MLAEMKKSMQCWFKWKKACVSSFNEKMWNTARYEERRRSEAYFKPTSARLLPYFPFTAPVR